MSFDFGVQKMDDGGSQQVVDSLLTESGDRRAIVTNPVVTNACTQL